MQYCILIILFLDPNTSLRLKLLSQAAKSHVDSPIPKATPRRSRRISKDESNDSLNNSKPISNVEPILEDAENVSDSDASSYSALKVPRRPRGRKISLDVDSPKRVTRRSSVTSDDESGKTGPTRATRGKRQSVAAPPTIDNITEETEDLNLSHELELRSRSVSRSPVVSQNDSASSSRPKQISPLALDNSSRIRRSDDGNKSVTFNETVPNDTATKMQYAKTPRKSTLLNEDESITILNTDSEDDDAEHIEKALTVKPVIRLSRYSFNISKEEKREQEKLSKSLGAKFDEEDAFIFKVMDNPKL